MQFLAEAGAALGSLDIGPSLDKVAALGARTIGDVSVVILVDERGDVEQVHFGHADDAILRDLETLKEDLRRGRLRLPAVYAEVMREGPSASSTRSGSAICRGSSAPRRCGSSADRSDRS